MFSFFTLLSSAVSFCGAKLQQKNDICKFVCHFFDDFMQLGVLGCFFMRSLFACRVAYLFLSGSIFVADDENYRAISWRWTLPMVAQWMMGKSPAVCWRGRKRPLVTTESIFSTNGSMFIKSTCMPL